MTSNAILKDGYLRLSVDVKLRKEYFGGLIFHRQTGTTLEVDCEAHQLLCWLKQTGWVKADAFIHRKTHAILPVLLSEEIVEMSNEAKCSHDIRQTIADYGWAQDLQNSALSAPETVHLAVTYRCESNCIDCYARGYVSDRKFDTDAMCSIINDIANQGVFQLAIGGGEPFIRPDLGDIVRHATDTGLVVHLTTGQYQFESRNVEVLQHIKSLHVGIRSESLITDTDNTIAKLHELASYASQTKTFIGANLIITRFTINQLHKLVELLASCGFQRLIFLRYKPIHDSNRWHSENPDKEALHAFEGDLLHIKSQYPRLAMRLDCASAFLMRDMDRDTALKASEGCVAGNRILSVSPDSSVYPCSQLVGAKYHAGNLTQKSLGVIWRESDVLNRYRKFRQSASFENSACGRCVVKDYCGGCRIFAEDALGGEASCPLGQKYERLIFMDILSIRRGFASDHNSTSYEFLAVDKPLGKKERSEVSELSSRANPSTRRVSFIYHVDGYDIPGGWEKLMSQYYDVMYREEYSWWTLSIAFDADDKQYEAICAYEFDGADDLGIRVERSGKRVIISVHCVVEPGQYWDSDYYDDVDGLDENGDEDEKESVAVATGDHILDTLAQVRQQVIGGDYRALYAVWEVYGISDDEDESEPPKPKDKKSGAEVVKTFKDMLTTI